MNIREFQLRPTSIEKEIFPAMAADEQLYAFELKGKQVDVIFDEKNLKVFPLVFNSEVGDSEKLRRFCYFNQAML